MTNSQRLAKVRERLIEWISTHQMDAAGDAAGNGSAEGATPVISRESILIRDEFFCGRRFFTAEHQATWFIEEDELKIFATDGELLATLRGSEIDGIARPSTDEGQPEILRLPVPEDETEQHRRAA